MLGRVSLFLVLPLALAGCASIEGVYLPDCEAYAGSEIRLEAGRFHWSKFTDQVKLDEDGNHIDPFPGFPREGAYAVDHKTVTLTSASGEAPEILHLRKQGGAVYLLTNAEHAAVVGGADIPRCALKRQVPATKK